MFKQFKKMLAGFHADDGGAPEMSTVLIVALIAIPLIIIIIAFGNKIAGWFTKAGGDIESAPKISGGS